MRPDGMGLERCSQREANRSGFAFNCRVRGQVGYGWNWLASLNNAGMNRCEGGPGEASGIEEGCEDRIPPLQWFRELDKERRRDSDPDRRLVSQACRAHWIATPTLNCLRFLLQLSVQTVIRNLSRIRNVILSKSYNVLHASTCAKPDLLSDQHQA